MLRFSKSKSINVIVNNTAAEEKQLKKYWEYTGKVCKWIKSRSYGFIRMQGRKSHIYFHSDGIVTEGRTSLNPGEMVKFYIFYNGKTNRPKAIRVRVIESGLDAKRMIGFGLPKKAPLDNSPVFQGYNYKPDPKTNDIKEKINLNTAEKRTIERVHGNNVHISTAIHQIFQACNKGVEGAEEQKLRNSSESTSSKNTEQTNRGTVIMPMVKASDFSGVFTSPNSIFSDAYMQYVTDPQNQMNPYNFMNPLNMPMNNSQATASMNVSYSELEHDNTSPLLFPTNPAIQVEQLPIVNPNLRMRPSYDSSFQQPSMM